MQNLNVIKTKNTNYIVVQELGSGTYGRVLKAYDQSDPTKLVAIKLFHLDEHEEEGVPATSIRELDILKMLNHPNIVKLYDIHYSRPTDGPPVLFAVFELCTNDLKKYCKIYAQSLKERYIDMRMPIKEHTLWAKNLMFQLINGLAYCHANNIMHRDLKPQNVLMGLDGILKIGDFGLARTCRIPIPEYTHDVLTLWYRSPEILLGINKYTPSVDVWSVGCIMAELFRCGHALLPGECELDMVWRIFKLFGTPTIKSWPKLESLKYFDKEFPIWNCSPIENLRSLCKLADSNALDLMVKLLECNPDKRISCKDALLHPWFDDLDKSKYILWDKHITYASLSDPLIINFNSESNFHNDIENMNKINKILSTSYKSSERNKKDSVSKVGF